VFHIHTCYSFDCITPAAKIVQWAETHNVDVLAITDHNTLRGAREVAEKAAGTGVRVIIGAEYATDHGDIIGLFLEQEITSRDAFQVINDIREQGGVSVLPHPYHDHRAIENLAQAVDVIEVFNARCSEDQNEQAMTLATRLHKAMLAGADAHFLSDLRNCTCYIYGHEVTPKEVLSAERSWDGKRSVKSKLHWSQIIKAVKTRDPALAKAHVRALSLLYVKMGLGDHMYDKLLAIRRRRSISV
jgi:predicted metal-dependent phosphoesterase TrpH